MSILRLKLSPAASQEALKPVMDQLKAWGELAQQQAQAAQAAVLDTAQSFKDVKEPQAAFQALRASAQSGITLATKHLQEATALGVAQFHANVDAFQKAHPAPEAFATLGKSLKDTASTLEVALESAVRKGAAAVKAAKA